jgi:hypothetical protein
MLHLQTLAIRTAAIAIAIAGFCSNESKADFVVDVTTNGSNTTQYTTSSSYYDSSTNSYKITLAEGNGTTLTVTAYELVNSQGITVIDLGVQHTGLEAYTSLTIATSVTNVPTNPISLGYRFQDTSSTNVTKTTMQTWGGGDTLFAAPSLVNTTAITVASGKTKSGNIGFTSSSAYSITSQISLTGLGSVDSINLDDQNTIYPSPAPGGLSLMLSAFPALLIGAFTWRRSISIIRKQPNQVNYLPL